MKLPGFLLSLNREISQQELRRFIRSVAVIEGLLILVVASYCLLAPAGVSNAPAVFIALGIYSLACGVFRMRVVFARQTRLKLATECWAMVLFTTFVLWFTGGIASPLLGLYLLPITVSALALGRIMTAILVLALCALYVLVSFATAEPAIGSPAYLGAAAGRLVPLLLVAYLTSTLAADVFAARRRIESLAQTDSLTGLYNLRTFNDRYRQLHADALAAEEPYTLLMVDMDNLKAVNDEFGHEAGNSAIVLVANCIRRTVRTSDVAARFGGDEFVVLLPGVDPQTANAISQRLRNLVYNTTLDVGSSIIRSSVSIGMALFPKDGREARELLTLADRRMYRDKELRRRPVARAETQAQT